jgi:excisionase family DNA binding protein
MPVAVRLLTIREVAALLRLSPLSVYRRIDRGELKGIRLGENGPLRVEEDELVRYLEESGERV